MSTKRTYYYEKDSLKVNVSTTRYKFSLPFVRDKVVLDIGCGARKGPWIISDTTLRVVGTDISYDAISYCLRNWSKNNISYLVSDVGDLPFRNGSFDVVISFEVIEHIDDYRMYLSEVYRVLKEKGIFIISTPNRPVASPSGTFSNPDHLREFDLGEFENILYQRFPEITIYGQFPSERVKQIEYCRIKNLQTVSKIPKFLKTIFPNRFKESFLNKCHYLSAKYLKGIDREKVTEKDFPIVPENVEKARSLLALCKKQKG